MSAIKTIESDGTQLVRLLQDVLTTKSNEWNYFFYPYRIQHVFVSLTEQIQAKNFFTIKYSINIFLDFLIAYIKQIDNTKQLKTIDEKILHAFNQVIEALQERMIKHTTGLDESQQVIVSKYLNLLYLLIKTQSRDLYDKWLLKLNANTLQAMGRMLKNNSASLNNELIVDYISLLRLSFDIPKLLVNYVVDLDIIGLVKDCFLSKNINKHSLIAQIFSLLGYQGQLLDYHKDDPRFTINSQLLTNTTESLKSKAISLQQYFFATVNQYADMDKALLQHYLYIYFFKVLYKKYPNKLAALKQDRYLSDYIKFNYVALPNSLDCRAYLPADNTVIIEYKKLSIDPKIACQAIKCSSSAYARWQKALRIEPQQSQYTFRVAESYEKYSSIPYSYGLSPRAGGFYLSGENKHNVVTGIGYSFFANMQQFIDVARHEAVHHDNFKLYVTAKTNNPQISYFRNRNFNEGLAVLFAGGACAPNYISEDFSNITAPNLELLLDNNYIGYTTSWLYNNYIVQHYASSNKNFYSDILYLNKTVFLKKWSPILYQDNHIFFNWLSYLKRVCQNAEKKLSIEHCPSIYLSDYLSGKPTNTIVTTTERLSVNNEANFTSLLGKKLTADDMGRMLIFKISENKFAAFKTLLQEGANPNFYDEMSGNTLLHYIFSYSHCDMRYVELLFHYGAQVRINKSGVLPYAIAEKMCNATQLLTIKSFFDKQEQQLNVIKNDEVKFVPYQRQAIVLSFTIPISAFVSGAMTAGWKELAQRNKARYPYLPNIIFYGLQPANSALISAAMNFLTLGSAKSLGLENTWLSFVYYLGMNYLCLILAQLGEKATTKIQNKFLNVLIPILLYTFFFNPSLLITLLSEGFATMGVMMPLLSMLTNSVFFKLGEFSSKKLISRYSPADETPSSTMKGENKSIRFSIFAHSQKIPDDKKILEMFQKKFAELIKKIEKKINKQVYKLMLEEKIVIISNGVLELLSEINENKKYINTDSDKVRFKNIEEKLEEIMIILTNLKITKLRLQIADLLAMLRGIRPFSFKQENSFSRRKTVDSGATEEEQTSLITFFTKEKQYKLHLKNKVSSQENIDFPPPPTVQKLSEMEKVRDLSQVAYANI